jgi:ABC-type Fe3+ transport system substrate-binding protein
MATPSIDRTLPMPTPECVAALAELALAARTAFAATLMSDFDRAYEQMGEAVDSDAVQEWLTELDSYRKSEPTQPCVTD